MKPRHSILTGLLSLVLCLPVVPTLANEEAADYPTKPIDVLVGFRPGGSADSLMRVLSKHLREELGQPLVMRNRAGGGGSLAASSVERADPDGYTLGVIAMSNVTLDPQLREQSSYSHNDFDYIATIAKTQDAIIASGDASFSTLDEMVKFSEDEGRPLVYASIVPMDQLVMSYLSQQNGIEIRPLPTKGGGSVIQALMGGHADLGWSGGFHQQYLESGDIKVLAVPSNLRAKSSPDAPTLQEMGYDLVANNYFMVIVPGGTPDEITKRLGEAIEQSMQSDDYQELVRDRLQMLPEYHGPAELDAIVNESFADFAELIEATR